MIIFVYILFLSLLKQDITDQNEFTNLKKRAQLLEEEDEDKSDFDFEDGGVDDISANSDDIASTMNDKKQYEEPELPSIVPEDIQQAYDKEYLEGLTSKLNQSLGLDDEIVGLTDEKAWNKLYRHFELNLKDYMINGNLSIELHIRYFLCCYVIVFIPGEFAFFYPSMWPRLIPKVALKSKFFMNALTELRIFEKFVRKKSKESFLITFYFGRAKSLIDDLKFLIKIPVLILKDPLEIVKALLDFEIKSEGYKDFKEKNKDLKIEWNTDE